MKRFLIFLMLCATINISAQFPELSWQYETGAPSFGSSCADDLDGDGFYEIVFTTYTNDGRAHCINAEDGSVNWIYDIGGCGDVAPVIFDVTGDGYLDVVINGSCNPTVFCINGQTGELIWSEYSGGGDSSITIAEMDGDPEPEILFGNFNGQIKILNGEDGSEVMSIQADPNQYPLQSEPTVVDVNDDGQMDVIVGNYFTTDGFFFWAFDGANGELIWENEVLGYEWDYNAYHGGAVADIDNDGKLEYVAGSGGGFIRALNVEDGSTLWDIEWPGILMCSISIADLDNDDQLEVIYNTNDFITLNDKIAVADGSTGIDEWSYPIDFPSFRGMSISDIDGNGSLDLVSGHFMGKVRAIEPYVGLIWEVNLQDYFTQSFPYFEADTQPLIADFDQNGTADIFVVGGYGTYYPDDLNAGKAFMFEAGLGGCPEWLMFRHDIKRTGYLPIEQVIEECDEVGVDENELELTNLSVYPNPTNGFVNVSLSISKTVDLSFEIFDVTGKRISNKIFRSEAPGIRKYNDVFIGTMPGLYLIQFSVNGKQCYSEKVMVH